tara:strand:+ start:1588 stop:1779 length:192 start_codon:yes stop_codon:yes gene_type:complete
MQFVKRETLTQEITETGVKETTTKLQLSEQDAYRERLAKLPEFQKNRQTLAETGEKPAGGRLK